MCLASILSCTHQKQKSRPTREKVFIEGTDHHWTLFSRFFQGRQIRVFASNPQEHKPIHHFSPISHQISTSLFFPGLPATPSPDSPASIISFPITAFQDHLKFTPKFHFNVYTHTHKGTPANRLCFSEDISAWSFLNWIISWPSQVAHGKESAC